MLLNSILDLCAVNMLGITCTRWRSYADCMISVLSVVVDYILKDPRERARLFVNVTPTPYPLR